MTTPITANIGTAASAVVPTASANPAHANQGVSGAQLAQVSQAAAQKTQKTSESNDKRRGVQVPKRTEAAFATQKAKAVPGRSPQPEAKEEKPSVYADTNRLNIKI